MATKIDRIVTYCSKFLTIKSHGILITWSWKILKSLRSVNLGESWLTKTITSVLHQYLLSLNLVKWWLTLYCPHRYCLWSFDHVVLRDHKTNYNHYIHTTTEYRVTKFFKIVIYLEQLLCIKLLDPLITWFCKITWQTKTIVSTLPQCPWSPNLLEW